MNKKLFFVSLFLLIVFREASSQTLMNLNKHLRALEGQQNQDDTAKKEIARLKERIERLKRFSIRKEFLKDTSVLQFVGNGNIQKSVESGGSIPASTGLGVNYLQKFDTAIFLDFYKIEFDAFINIASTVDTIRGKYQNQVVNGVTTPTLTNSADFGSSALTPLVSGQAAGVNFMGHFTTSKLALIDGLRFKYNSANRYWSAGGGSATQTTLNSVRLSFFHDFLRNPSNKGQQYDDYSILVMAGFAYNTISGDMRQSQNTSLRKDLLGSTQTDFFGYELGVMLRLKNIRAELSYPVLYGAPNSIPGLTAGRLITTISFVGGFPIKLN